MAHVVWTLKASRHLEGIQDYIGRDSRVYARRFVRQLVRATRRLESEPLSGRLVPELADLGLREVVHRGYRIVYRIHTPTSTIQILAVVHGAQRLEKALGNPPPPST